MRRNILLALACLVLSAASARPASAEPLALGGKILDHQGKPLARATVEILPVPTFYEQHLARLQGKEPEPVATAAAGPDGRFQIAVPKPGLWQVRVEAAGFVPREYQLAPYLEPAELPEVRLGTASPLKVQVLDPQGRPVGGARVAASMDMAREIRITSDWLPGERTGTTGPDGTVTLLREELEDLKVQAVAPGHSEGEAPSSAGAAGGAAVQIRLPAGCEATVEVVDRERKPMAGALVAVTRWTGGLTDATGRLALTLPCGKEVKLQAGLADGRRVETLLGAKRAAGEPARLSLPPQPLRLAGRVLEEGTRQPIASALVWAHDAGRAVWTDRTGAYTLTTPPSPKLMVQAASRHHSRGWALHAPGATESGTQDGPSFALSPVVAAAGIVVDEAGKPVAGADVAGFPIGRWGRSRSGDLRTRTGDRGTFRLLVSPGAAHELEASHPDFAAAQVSLPEIAPRGERKDLRIVLRKGQTATGTVIDSQDKPVAGARIVLSPVMPPDATMRALHRAALQHGLQDQNAATSGADGRFSIPRLTPGRFDLWAHAAGFGPMRVPGLEIPDSPGPVSLGTVILPPGVELAGIVVDAQDRPVAGARIGGGSPFSGMPGFSTAGEAQGATTGGDGRFVLSSLGAGDRMSLSVAAEGYVTRSVSGIELPLAEPLRIVLSASSRISGRVLDERGQPVQGAMIQANRAGSEWGGEHAMSDESGRFAIGNLEAGTLAVRAEAPGLRPAEVGNLELAPGKSLENVEIVLRAGAVVVGQVFGPDGKPVSGAYVSVAGRSGDFSFMPALSDGEGRYRLEGVEPGPRVVAASHSDYLRANKDLDVQAGENRLDFRLTAGHTVAGRVVDPAGEPVEGAELALQATTSGRGATPVRSGADGGFRFLNVTPDTYSLRAERQGYAAGSLPEVRVAGPVEGLEIRLDRGGVIRGRVTGVDFPDLGKVGVMAGREDQQGRQGRPVKLDFRGEYRIEGLAAGEWQVMAFVFEDGRRAEGRVELAPGGEAVLDLELKAGALTLSGRVLRRGEPVDGVQVWVQGTGVRPGGAAMTNQDGVFRITGLEPGSHTLLLSGSFRSLHRQTVELTGDQEIVIELPESQVRGRVVDAADSTPVAEAAVRLEPVVAAPDPSGFGWPPSTHTDSAGNFTLTDIGEGSYRVIARKEGYGPAESTIQVGPGASVEGIRLELSPTQGLTLQVSGPAGIPGSLTVALVDASGQAVLSGGYPVVEGGRVRVTEAPPGTWRLLALSPESAVASTPVTVPGPTVPIVLPPAFPLVVTVPPLVGSPVAATLALQGADGHPYQTFGWGGGGALIRQWPLQEGRTQLTVPPGTWRLTVTAADGRTWRGTATAAPGKPAEVTLQ